MGNRVLWYWVVGILVMGIERHLLIGRLYKYHITLIT